MLCGGDDMIMVVCGSETRRNAHARLQTVNCCVRILPELLDKLREGIVATNIRACNLRGKIFCKGFGG